MHGTEEAARLFELRVAVAKIPADDDAGLAAAYNAAGVELQLEHTRSISTSVLMAMMVMVVVRRRFMRLSCSSGGARSRRQSGLRGVGCVRRGKSVGGSG